MGTPLSDSSETNECRSSHSARRTVECSASPASVMACSCAASASFLSTHLANTTASGPSGSGLSPGEIVVSHVRSAGSTRVTTTTQPPSPSATSVRRDGHGPRFDGGTGKAARGCSSHSATV